MSAKSAKTTKSASGVKTILVSVNLLNHEGGKATPNQNVSKIVAWYKQRMTTGSYFPGLVTNFKISPVALNLFEIEYKTKNASFAYPEIIADPDQDGNHEIKIGKLTYLISGKYIKTAGSVIKPKKVGANKFLMNVMLSNPAREIGDDTKKVIAWYKKQLSGNYYSKHLSYFKMSHITGSLFTVEWFTVYGLDQSYLSDELIANPDDDGSKPIKLDKTKHLVGGQILRKF